MCLFYLLRMTSIARRAQENPSTQYRKHYDLNRPKNDFALSIAFNTLLCTD
jgi:hypothetical protein